MDNGYTCDKCVFTQDEKYWYHDCAYGIHVYWPKDTPVIGL